MREVGTSMNVGSLISDFGLGNIGESSYNFIDFLHDTGQSYWQLLPINQTEVPHNPYKPISSFAMEPNFLDFHLLRKASYLISEDLAHVSIGRFKTNIDYYNLKINIFKVLRRAYLRGQSWDIDEIRDFRAKNSYWIKYYAHYMTLKEHFQENNYMHWDLKARYPNPEQLQEYETIFSQEVYFWYFLQYRFYRQWRELKKYAEGKNIKLIGELPAKVINASVDMWAYSHLFLKKSEGNNDYAKHNWKEHEKDNYSWWQEKFRLANKMYHLVKITIDDDLDEYLRMLDFLDVDNIILEINTDITKDNMTLIEKNGYYLARVMKKNEGHFLLRKSDINNTSGNIKQVVYTSQPDKPLNTLLKDVGFLSRLKDREFFSKNIFRNANWDVIDATLESEDDIAIISFRDIINRSKKVILEDVGGRINNWSWRLGVRSVDKDIERHLKNKFKKTNRYNKKTNKS